MDKMTTCPICQTKVNKIITRIETIEGFERFLCENCCAIYIAPDNYELPIYNKEYNDHFNRPSDINKAGIYAAKIANMMGYPNTNKSFIEIGPGNALIPFLLKEMGFKACAMDCAEDWCNYFYKKHGIAVYSSYLENFNANVKFDFVYCSHVIEHSKNPLLFLEKLKNICNDNGKIFLATPDTYYYRNHFKDWKHLNTRNKFEHCFLYSKASIQKLINMAGLQIVEFTRLEKYESMELLIKKRT